MKHTLRWLAENVDGRDVLVGAGVLATAYGAARLHPAAGWIVFGVLLLYVTLLHGAVHAWLLRRGTRPPGPQERT